MRPALSRTTRRTRCFARSWRSCTARCTSRSSCSTPRHRRPLRPSPRRLCRRWCAQRASAHRARPSSPPPGSRPSAPSTRECSSASRSSRRARSSSRTSTRSRSDKYVLWDNKTVQLVILVSYMYLLYSTCTRDGNGPGLKIQARGPYGPYDFSFKSPLCNVRWPLGSNKGIVYCCNL